MFDYDLQQTRCVYRHTLTPVTPLPGGHIIKVKVIENVLRGRDLTHRVDKKCSDMIFNRPSTIIKPRVLFWGKQGLGDSQNSTTATDNVQWTLSFDPPPPIDNVHSHLMKYFDILILGWQGRRARVVYILYELTTKFWTYFEIKGDLSV